MRWVLVALGAYGVVMVLLIAAMQYAARANHLPVRYYSSSSGGYAIAVYVDYPLPFHLGGAGHPGTVELYDHGHEIDSERVDDAFTVRDVRFDQYNAYFRYVSHGTVYQSTFQIIQ